MEWQWSSIEIMHLHSIEITIIYYYVAAAVATSITLGPKGGIA